MIGAVPFLRKLTTPALLLAALAANPLAASADEARAGVRASALAQSGRCAEALDVLAGVESPSAGLLFLRGRCHLELKQYPAAVTALEASKAADASTPHIDLHLGMALFQLGDFNGAEVALAEAEATSSERAEFHLYRGLLQLQKTETADAAQSLDRARRISPAVEPTASYYAGLAYAGSEDEEAALEALDRVIEIAPGSVWAAEAEQAKLRLTSSEQGGSWWAWARAGIEYDDNVVLRSNDGVLPDDISGSHDARAVWVLHGGYEFLRKRDWSAGVSLTYYGSSHFDLDDFDQHYPVLSLWVDHRLARPTTLRLRYDVGHAWIDSSPFLNSHTLTPTLFHDWGESGRSKVFASFYKYNYLFGGSGDVIDGRGQAGSRCLSATTLFCAPAGINESTARNRDGWGLSVGADHTIPLGFLETELTGGYRFHRFSARGSEYSFSAHEFRIGTESLLPYEFLLRTQVSYMYRSYRNNSTFPDPDDVVFNREYRLQNENRRDDQWVFQIDLERKLTENLSAEISYRYFKNHSNVSVFDYDRETLGFYVTYRVEE